MEYKILELVQGMEKGGRTKRIVETATGLSQHGWQVKILSMTPAANWVKSQYEGQVEWLELYRRPKLDLQYVFRLAKLLKKEGISLVHAQCEASYFYGGLAARLCGIPVVGTYHRSLLKYYEPNWKLRFRARLLTRAVAISNDRMNLMISGLNIGADKITLIHGGIDLDAFQLLPPAEVQRLKQEFGMENRRVLLSVGHLGPIKGHQVTIQALPLVLERFPDIICVIAGDGAPEDYEYLNGMIEDLGLSGHVKLLGQVHNVIEWLNICDLFVQPSLEEGFGLVFVEAGACKKPVVSTAVGGIKDIVKDKETGLLVKPGDVNGLAEAINTLLADPQKASDFGEAAFKHVHDSFSLNNMSDKYDKLFSSMLGKPECKAGLV